MTPAELQLMRMMLREEIEPVREDVRKLSDRTTRLEAKSGQLSGQQRAVTKQMLPQLASSVEDSRRGDAAGMSAAFNRLADAVAEIRADMQPRAVVELSDGRGGKSIRPASLVAAESSVRTENTANKIEGKADAIQVAANRADSQSLAAKVATHRVLIAQILSAIALTAWQIWEHIK